MFVPLDTLEIVVRVLDDRELIILDIIAFTGPSHDVHIVQHPGAIAEQDSRKIVGSVYPCQHRFQSKNISLCRVHEVP